MTLSLASDAFGAVSADDLIEYPIAADTRLDSHHFVSWEFRRWLNSQMRMKGTPECRAYYFDLINIAHDQTPVGTLPRDPEVLSKLLHVDLGVFQRLCTLEFGPLYLWRPCLVEGVVRLYHPMVLQTVQDAIMRKEHNRARTEAAARDKRLQRLRTRVGALDPKVGENDAAIMAMDEWLVEQGCTTRTEMWIHRALDMWLGRSFRVRQNTNPMKRNE